MFGISQYAWFIIIIVIPLRGGLKAWASDRSYDRTAIDSKVDVNNYDNKTNEKNFRPIAVARETKKKNIN